MRLVKYKAVATRFFYFDADKNDPKAGLDNVLDTLDDY